MSHTFASWNRVVSRLRQGAFHSGGRLTVDDGPGPMSRQCDVVDGDPNRRFVAGPRLALDGT
jgi:hypothetical protein